MATWTFKKVSDTTVKVVVEFQANKTDDCAGWYVRNGEIVGRVWEDQPSRYLPKNKISAAMKLI
jgi:hypothetical protein